MENKLYYSIGEAAEAIGVAPSVLRFWEGEFPQLHPVKNRKGNRSYTAADLELLRRIHFLTRDCGYTLEGAREQLRRRSAVDPREQAVRDLTQVRQFLVDLKDQL